MEDDGRVSGAESSRDGDQASFCFTVRDTGVATVEAAALDKIFQPFFQAEYGIRLGEGTGLGLAICREYAHLLGGELSAESTPGVGSTFHFSLRAPLVAAPEVERRRHVIRMPRVSGFYAIEATGDGRSRVHYELDADPGGNLPDLFISLQSSRNPFRTLTGIRRQLERTRGQYDQQIERFPQAVPHG